MKENTILHPSQVEASKEGYANLWEQLEFGRFTSIKSGAAPTLYQEIVATGGQTDFTLPQGTYTVGDHSLQVFVNGQLMRIGSDNDYIEVDNHSIRFTFKLDEEDVVVFRVNGGTSGPSMHEDQRAIAGQTIFDLAGSYMTGNHSLVVYVNGAYQTLNVDYNETHPKQVVFTEPLEEGDLVTFRVEGLPAMESKYQNQESITTYDQNGRIVRRETLGNTHIIKEFEYNTDGTPSRMIVREGGYIITKTYLWENGYNTMITETVREGT